MENWEHRVREQLKSCTRSGEIHDDVIVELAVHLEEIYQDALSRGLNEIAAFEITQQEVDDWRRLAAEICRTRSKGDSMNYRTRSLWLPAMITLLGASLSLTVTQLLGLRPQLVWIDRVGFEIYWPWLLSLPIFGAVGAHLSRRALGATQARLAAGLAPALVMLITMCLILPWGFALDGLSFFRLVHFGIGLADWVVLPGLALLAGAAPFLGPSGQVRA